MCIQSNCYPPFRKRNTKHLCYLEKCYGDPIRIFIIGFGGIFEIKTPKRGERCSLPNARVSFFCSTVYSGNRVLLQFSALLNVLGKLAHFFQQGKKK